MDKFFIVRILTLFHPVYENPDFEPLVFFISTLGTCDPYVICR
jgi:hypothetical protein